MIHAFQKTNNFSPFYYKANNTTQQNTTQQNTTQKWIA